MTAHIHAHTPAVPELPPTDSPIAPSPDGPVDRPPRSPVEDPAVPGEVPVRDIPPGEQPVPQQV